MSELRSVNMKLLREPFVPSQYQLAAVAGRMLPHRVHPTWRPYLGSNLQSSSGKEQPGRSRGEEELFLDVDILD